MRNVPLNAIQLEVLAWVRDGCPDGVYENWSHRVTARALHNHGLLTVRGHGAGWSAELTDDGAYYLANGTYPEAGSPSVAARAHAKERHEPARAEGKPWKATPVKKKDPGPVDRMMATLQEAEGHRLVIPSAEESRYRQLAGAAKRFGRIPDGMQITVGWGPERQRIITLEPLPEWQTAVLEPLPVPRQLRDPSEVVSALAESGTFQVTGTPRKRALLLAEALVVAARKRDMTVRLLVDRPVNDYYRYRDDGPRRDELEFVLGTDKFRLWFTQDTLQEPHEATPREVVRARRGILFPDFDNVPADDLRLVLGGPGGRFWADSWMDLGEHRLEDDLGQVLEEMNLRHHALAAERDAERKRHESERRQHEEDKARARVRYHDQFLIDAMNAQAHRWEDAGRLHRYAEAVRSEAKGLDDHERERALAWADQIEAHAAETDPLPTAAAPPNVPEPSSSDLAPFMGSRRSYR